MFMAEHSHFHPDSTVASTEATLLVEAQEHSGLNRPWCTFSRDGHDSQHIGLLVRSRAAAMTTAVCSGMLLDECTNALHSIAKK